MVSGQGTKAHVGQFLLGRETGRVAQEGENADQRRAQLGLDPGSSGGTLCAVAEKGSDPERQKRRVTNGPLSHCLGCSTPVLVCTRVPRAEPAVGHLTVHRRDILGRKLRPLHAAIRAPVRGWSKRCAEETESHV